MLTLAKLHALLGQHNCSFELIHHETEILSATTDVQHLDMGKTALVFLLESRHGYAALIISGARCRPGFGHVRESAPELRDYHLAAKSIVGKIIDCAAGVMPLVGHGLPCFFDDSLLRHDYIFGGSGDNSCTLKIDPRDVLRMNEIICKI